MFRRSFSRHFQKGDNNLSLLTRKQHYVWGLPLKCHDNQSIVHAGGTA